MTGWLLGVLACGGDGGGGAPPPAVGVRPVAERPVAAKVPVRGELVAREQAELRARVSAFVAERRVDVGDRVRAGDVLVRLSATELVADRSRAEAELRGAEARLSRLEAAARAEGVVAPGDLDAARADVDALRGAVRAAGTLAGELRVVAPFDGVISARGADPGTLVGPQGPALPTVVGDDPLRLVAYVPERFAAAAAPGLDVGFRLATGERATAPVARVAGAVEPRTRTVRVELDVPNPDGHLRPGTSADVDWPVSTGGPALLVPATAIVRSTEGVAVFVVRGGALERVPVEPGLGDQADLAVRGALAAGDLVVVRGSEDLVSGAAVLTRDEPAKGQ